MKWRRLYYGVSPFECLVIVFLAMVFVLATAILLSRNFSMRGANLNPYWDEVHSATWGSSDGLFTKWLYISFTRTDRQDVAQRAMPSHVADLFERGSVAVDGAEGFALIVIGKGIPIPWLYSAKLRHSVIHADIGTMVPRNKHGWPYDPMTKIPSHIDWLAFFIDVISVSGIICVIVMWIRGFRSTFEMMDRPE